MIRGCVWGFAWVICLAGQQAMAAFPVVVQEESLSGSLPAEMTFDAIRGGSDGVLLTLRTPGEFSGSLDIYSIGDLRAFPWTLETNESVMSGARIKMGLSMSDSIRFYHAADAGVDSDQDGIPDAREIFLHGTDSYNADTDGDMLPDGWELIHQLDPLDSNGPHGAEGDPDGDQISNLWELQSGTHPQNTDTDDDGLTDAEELIDYLTDPINPDSDHDGVSDGQEVGSSGDPLDAIQDPFVWAAVHQMPSVIARLDTGRAAFYVGMDLDEDQMEYLNGDDQHALPRDQIPLQSMGFTSGSGTYLTLQQIEPGLLQIIFDGHGPNDGSPVVLIGHMTLENGHFTGFPEQTMNDATDGWVIQSSPTTIEWAIYCNPYDGQAEDDPYRGWTIWQIRYEPDMLEVDLVPDWNHDRGITAADEDQATTSNPFRFWVNDDDDSGDVASGDSDLPGHWGWGTSRADYSNGAVDGRCDLLDFFPVWLDVHDALNILPPGSTVEYKLRQANGAVRAVFTDLTKDSAGAFLTTEGNTYGPSFNQASHEADTLHITADGVALPVEFLDRIKNDATKGILLIEGRCATTASLVLEVWKDGQIVCEKEMPLSIDGVEKMYRWVNLRPGQQGDSRTGEPKNNPDIPTSANKNVIFLHGFNANVEGARMWNAEIFKRLYQSGSRAKFWGMTWEGDIGLISELKYQEDVANALNVSSNFYAQVSGISGTKIILAHSLGNMVVSSAIQDHGLSLDKYFMLNAAVASECYDPASFNTSTNANYMLHSTWSGYDPNTWCSLWFSLFSSSDDNRKNLTWKNRFPRVISVAYNFYSSSDEIFETHRDPILFSGNPWHLERYAWQKQELFKGRSLPGGTDWAGWGFAGHWESHFDSYTWVSDYSIEEANSATPDSLRINPVFLHKPATLFGSEITTTEVNNIIAQGVPALSCAAGVNEMSPFGPSRNYNMDDYKLNGWGRNGFSYGDRWLHSDLKSMAYFYTYDLYDQVVLQGDL